MYDLVKFQDGYTRQILAGHQAKYQDEQGPEYGGDIVFEK